MTSDRPYIRARSAAEALAELRRGSGSQFDPRVAESFCRLFEGGRLGEIFLGSRRTAAGPPARAAAAPSPAAAPAAAPIAAHVVAAAAPRGAPAAPSPALVPTA